MNTNTAPALQIQNEAYGKAIEVAADFWVIASHHHPAGSMHNPEINNRCLVFKLKDVGDKNRPVLLVVMA